MENIHKLTRYQVPSAKSEMFCLKQDPGLSAQATIAYRVVLRLVVKSGDYKWTKIQRPIPLKSTNDRTFKARVFSNSNILQ